MRSSGPAVAVLALWGAAAAWGQGLMNDSPRVSAGWQQVDAASSVGGASFRCRNRIGATKETAAWSLEAPAAGDYQIQVYIPPADEDAPRTKNATYIVHRGRGILIRDRVDQTLSGWQTIGTYRVGKGPVGLTLTDRTGEREGTTWVVADAMRLLQADESPALNAALASSDLTRSTAAGRVVTFDVRLTNTGQGTWVRDPAAAGQTPVRLALVQGPAPFCDSVAAWEPGYGWLPRSRDRVIMDTPQVAPGETGSFLFSMQLAQNLTPGAYSFRFRPVAEPAGAGDGGVMATDIVVSVNVTARPQNELDFSGLQLYRSNLSVHTNHSDGDKLLDINLPNDRSPAGALAYAKTRNLNILGLTDHGEALNAAEWAAQADAAAAQTATAVGSPFFVGLRGFKWSATTGPHDFFGFPWEGSPTDLGHISIYGTSTWTGTRAVQDGTPPQVTPQFVAPAAPGVTLSGSPTSLADWLWVNGYPRPNAVDNGVLPAQFNHPSLFFRSSFFREFEYEPDMDRFFPLLAVGTGEFGANYTGVPDLVNQISDKGGYRFLGPDTPAEVANRPPDEILALPADVLATLGNPQDMSTWGTNPNNRNRFWFETALRKGWHVAPSINGDNHAGCYCDDAGYTGVWARSVAGQSPAQAQAAILDAIRERSVFASEDRGLSAQFSVFSSGTQYRMGQRNVPLTGNPTFRLDLASVSVGGFPADVDVQEIFIISNDGAVRISGELTGETRRVETMLPVNVSAGQERFFYALVVQRDGERLLTAPIWMTSCCPQPMCKVWPTEGKPGPGVCTILGFMSQNGTSATLSIDGGPAFPVPLTGSRPILISELNPALQIHTATFRVEGPCGVAVCSVQILCEGTGGQFGTCVINATPETGDCTTQFTVTWNSVGLANTRLILDNIDQGPVPASGSRVIQAPSSGTHTVKLVGTSNGTQTECTDTFVVSPVGGPPDCRMSVQPSAGPLGAVFDVCFFASNASRVDVYVDGVLKCTQLNPIPGVQYDCRFTGFSVGLGFHTATVVATGCGGTCTRSLPFLVHADKVDETGGPPAGQPPLAPNVLLSGTSLNFGSHDVGSTSPVQQVLISNTGTAPLSISSLMIAGANPGDFAITAGSGPGVIQPGHTRLVDLTFTPTLPGPRSAALQITSNASGSPHSVSLAGTGVSTAPPAPAVSLSTTSINFGSVMVNGSSVEMPIVVTNTGTAPLSIFNVTFGGAGTMDFRFTGGDSAGTLNPGQSRTITVQFTPKSGGAHMARVDIITNASTSPDQVFLSGTGT